MTEQELLNYLLEEHKKNTHETVPLDEFREDVMRLVYVGRLIKKYNRSNQLNVRLLINHIVILYNTFGNHTTGLLFLLSDADIHNQIFSLLSFFDKIPNSNEINCFETAINIECMQIDNEFLDEIKRVLNND
jgi:hypothetical protein